MFKVVLRDKIGLSLTLLVLTDWLPWWAWKLWESHRFWVGHKLNKVCLNHTYGCGSAFFYTDFSPSPHKNSRKKSGKKRREFSFSSILPFILQLVIESADNSSRWQGTMLKSDETLRQELRVQKTGNPWIPHTPTPEDEGRTIIDASSVKHNCLATISRSVSPSGSWSLGQVSYCRPHETSHMP